MDLQFPTGKGTPIPGVLGMRPTMFAACHTFAPSPPLGVCRNPHFSLLRGRTGSITLIA